MQHWLLAGRGRLLLLLLHLELVGQEWQVMLHFQRPVAVWVLHLLLHGRAHCQAPAGKGRAQQRLKVHLLCELATAGERRSRQTASQRGRARLWGWLWWGWVPWHGPGAQQSRGGKVGGRDASSRCWCGVERTQALAAAAAAPLAAAAHSFAAAPHPSHLLSTLPPLPLQHQQPQPQEPSAPSPPQCLPHSDHPHPQWDSRGQRPLCRQLAVVSCHSADAAPRS